MIGYHSEASKFVKRASELFPVSQGDIQVLLRLWVESDYLDPLILPLLDQLNTDLMNGQAEIETSRSVSTRPSPFGAFDESAVDEVVYECIWSLTLPSGPSVSIHLAVSEDGIFDARAVGNFSGVGRRVGYPIECEPLKDALISVFVAEMTYA